MTIIHEKSKYIFKKSSYNLENTFLFLHCLLPSSEKINHIIKKIKKYYYYKYFGEIKFRKTNITTICGFQNQISTPAETCFLTRTL